MTDDSQDRSQPEPPDSGRSGGTLGSVRATLARRDSRGRPLAVYAILGAGVFTLLVLMLVIYVWSTDRDKPEQNICTAITTEHARADIRDGRVERFVLNFDEGVETPTDAAWGPVQARLDYADAKCTYLPQGIMNQADVLAILGEITFYNQVTESAQVEIVYNAMTGLDPALFTTPTQPPTETPPTEPPPGTPAATPATETPPPPLTTPASPAATPRHDTPPTTPAVTPTPPPIP